MGVLDCKFVVLVGGCGLCVLIVDRFGFNLQFWGVFGCGVCVVCGCFGCCYVVALPAIWFVWF